MNVSIITRGRIQRFLVNGSYHIPIPEKLLKKSWDSWKRAKKSFRDSVLPVGAVLAIASDQEEESVASKIQVVWDVKESGVRKIAAKNNSSRGVEQVKCGQRKVQKGPGGTRPKSNKGLA